MADESDHTDEPAQNQGGGMLTSLLAPLRLPERVLEALEALVESTRKLGPINSELTSVRKQTEPLNDLLPALDRLDDDLAGRLDAVLGVVTALESEDSHLARAVGGLDGSLGRRLDAVQDVVKALESEDSHLARAVGGLDGSLGRRLDAVQDVVKALESEDSHLGRAVRGLDESLGPRLDAVHEVVKALESENSHLNRGMNEVGAHVGALREALAPVGQRLTTIEKSVNHLASEVDAIHQGLDGIREDIQRVTGLQGERGMMERARDAITGKDTSESE
jgi:methyl-accepting chemotaxis protein